MGTLARAAPLGVVSYLLGAQQLGLLVGFVDAPTLYRLCGAA